MLLSSLKYINKKKAASKSCFFEYSLKLARIKNNDVSLIATPINWIGVLNFGRFYSA